MATVNEIELPIKEAPLSGPAIDEWNGRKEDNNNDRFTSAKLKANFEGNKEAMFAELRVLTER